MANTQTSFPTPNETVLAAAQNQKLQFCDGLKNYFALKLPTTWKNPDRLASANLASKLIAKSLIDQDFLPYLSMADVEPKYAAISLKQNKYFAVADALGHAIGAKKQIIFTDNVSDLKFLPFSMQNRDLILATNTAEPLSPKRMRAVIATARRLSIRVNVIWTGAMDTEVANAQEALVMATVAKQTGGRFVSIGQDENTCYSLL